MRSIRCHLVVRTKENHNEETGNRTDSSGHRSVAGNGSRPTRRKRAAAAWANAYYILIAPHNVGGPASTAASLHLAASTTNFKIQEYFNDFDEEYVKHAADGLPEVVDGYFTLPSAPGLGLTLNEDVIEAHPQRELHFNLFAEDWHRRSVSSE